MLRHLMNHPDETVSVDELVDLILTSETSSTAGSQQNRERVALGIQYILLSYLTDAGVVEYEPDTERVRYHPHPRLEELLQCLDRLYP